jgi:hypothetical protein
LQPKKGPAKKSYAKNQQLKKAAKKEIIQAIDHISPFLNCRKAIKI